LAGLTSGSAVKSVSEAENVVGKVDPDQIAKLEAELSDLRGQLDEATRSADRWKTEAYRTLGLIRNVRVMLEADEFPSDGKAEGRPVEDSPAPTHAARGGYARATDDVSGGPATLQSRSVSRPASSPDTPSAPSPAAIAIADLLDRINPARVTWTQAAAMTGRKASGGNFNAARKWLRGSGRIVEDGDVIRSAARAPAGMSRAEALDLWRSVLTSPAPKMIDAFVAQYVLTKQQLGEAIGAQPRGGNFNNGLAQLRRNGLIDEVAKLGTMSLARPLPGERSDGR
jgi:hypothetical protein